MLNVIKSESVSRFDASLVIFFTQVLIRLTCPVGHVKMSFT